MTRRNYEQQIQRIFSEAPGHVEHLEASFTVDDFKPMSDVGVIILYSVALGIAAGVLVWVGTAYKQRQANAEAAALICCFFIICGMVLAPIYLTINRRQTIKADYLPVQGQPPEAQTEPRFFAWLDDNGRMRAIDIPPDWTDQEARQYAAHAWNGEGYDLAYEKRPDWLGKDMLKVFRVWLQERGYGREQGEKRPWLWYDEGVQYMDRLRGI